MNFPAFHSSSRHLKHTLRRGVAGMCALASGVLMLGGCSSVVEAADQAVHQFSADASLLGPASSTTYVVRGDAEVGNGAEVIERDAAEPLEAEEPVAPELPATSGTLVISNGMITSAELVASVESVNDIRFVLTEPALFERRGEVLESIQALGTLSTPTAMYPDTRVTLTPETTEAGTFVDATFNVPGSLTTDTSRTITAVQLKLFIEPLATFDNTKPEQAAEAEAHAPDDTQPEPKASEEAAP